MREVAHGEMRGRIATDLQHRSRQAVRVFPVGLFETVALEGAPHIGECTPRDGLNAEGHDRLERVTT